MAMTEQEKWKWQEPGRAWKGAGLYHVTLTATERRPVLGRLSMPDGDPTKARVVRTALGDALVDCLLSIPHWHPEVQVLHFCLMPDHLHAVLYVRRSMPKGIGTVVRGFWQAAKKLGRACQPCLLGSAVPPPVPSFLVPNDIREEHEEGEGRGKEQHGIREEHEEGEGRGKDQHGIQEEHKEEGRGMAGMREGLKEESRKLRGYAEGLRGRMGDEAYYRLAPVFEQMPFVRPMARYSQLPSTIRYIDMNPQRLATKRLRPGFFRVQKDITIGLRSYDGVGNAALLMEPSYAPVHVSHKLEDKAVHDDTELRNYKNSCVLKARRGVVMVSPFISPDEKQVLEVLMQEQRPIILLTDNGFRDYYKPADSLFDACAAGRLLILSPWPYDGGKRHISRSECVALNAMAEEICMLLGDEEAAFPLA